MIALAAVGCEGEGSPRPGPSAPNSPSASAARAGGEPALDDAPREEPGGTITTGGGTPEPVPSSEEAELVCARLRRCCAAFAEAVGDASERERARIACEELDRLGDLGDARALACEGALEGFRRELEARAREVPDGCR